MAVRWGEAGWALVIFIVLVGLPIAAIRYLPEQTISQLSSLGLDVQSLANQTAMLGLVVSAIVLAKAIVTPTSLAYLILDVSSNVVSLVFALLVVGAGNIESLGYSSFRITEGKLTTEIALDLHVFIYLTVAAVAISVLQLIAKYREVRAGEKATTSPN